MTATLFRYLNEQGYKFSMITTEISSHERYLLEEGVRLLSSSLLENEKHPCNGLFFSTSVANETVNFKHLARTKPMGENTITNIMKVSVAGTSLKESEEKSLRIIVQEKQRSAS